MMISAKKLSKMIQQCQELTERILFPSCDGVDSCCAGPSVDKGHFAVYTADKRRFVVPLAYLNNPLFRQLLKMSEEEYGLLYDGPIVLPCDSVFMDYALCLIRKGRDGDFSIKLCLSRMLARSRCSSSCLHGGQMQIDHQLQIQLILLCLDKLD